MWQHFMSALIPSKGFKTNTKFGHWIRNENTLPIFSILNEITTEKSQFYAFSHLLPVFNLMQIKNRKKKLLI